MAIIHFPELIGTLSETSFDQLKANSSNYIRCCFLEESKVTKDVYLEALGTYLSGVESALKIKDDKLAEIYANTLFKYVDNRISMAKNAEKARRYFERLKSIRDAIREETEDVLPLLEDFTKLFLCLYARFARNGQKIVEIQLDLGKIDFESVYNCLLKDEPDPVNLEANPPAGLDAILPKEVIKQMDQALDLADDFRRNTQKFMDGVASKAPGLKKKPDYSMYPVYMASEFRKNPSLYTDKNYALFLLRILYYHMRDLETTLKIGESE